MNTLEENREKIDHIDQELAKLFTKRFACVKEILLYKEENHLPVFDSSREKMIVEHNSKLVEEEIRPYFCIFYKELLKSSRMYQEDLLKKGE